MLGKRLKPCEMVKKLGFVGDFMGVSLSFYYDGFVGDFMVNGFTATPKRDARIGQIQRKSDFS